MSNSSFLDQSERHLEMLHQSAEAVKSRLGSVPETLVIAGSGLGQFADLLADSSSVSYEVLPHFPRSTVVGHAGKLVWGRIGSTPVVVMAGRKHLYEGVDIRETVIPLRSLILAGVRRVIVSNAAGGLNKQMLPGSLMLINDHVNMQFQNPLIGANLSELGPRFPDMSAPYDPVLMANARAAALRLGITLHEGVYVALSGPTYETAAEVGMLKMLGDAVGMSTVPETIVANHMGVPVLGITAITNSHVQRVVQKTTHEEVIAVGKQVGADFCRLVSEIITHS
ncbi:MAG: purine-nucleoside phosphorylase [Candidatus Sumerlaeia bacterium]|nr:purine-nucleoside phosphorylase [Candidatus Sumerlaeia bacterium]